jgi:hypothetical protein
MELKQYKTQTTYFRTTAGAKISIKEAYHFKHGWLESGVNDHSPTNWTSWLVLASEKELSSIQEILGASSEEALSQGSSQPDCCGLEVICLLLANSHQRSGRGGVHNSCRGSLICECEYVLGPATRLTRTDSQKHTIESQCAFSLSDLITVVLAHLKTSSSKN